MHDLMSFNMLYGVNLLDLIFTDNDALAVFTQKLDLVQADDALFIDVYENRKIYLPGIDFLFS